MPNTALPTLAELENANEFQARHLGPWDEEQAQMLNVIGVASREALMEGIVPASIRRARSPVAPNSSRDVAAVMLQP